MNIYDIEVKTIDGRLRIWMCSVMRVRRDDRVVCAPININHATWG